MLAIVFLASVLALGLVAQLMPHLQGVAYVNLMYLRTVVCFGVDRVWRRITVLLRSGHVEPRSGDSRISEVFMTRALRVRGVIDSPTFVTKVELSAQGLDRGFVGAMTRIKVIYSDGGAQGRPDSFVMKCQGPSLKASFNSVTLGSTREARWYKGAMANPKIAGQESSMPAVYYASYNRYTGRFCVIMEDLAGQGNSLQLMGNQCWGPPPAPPAGAPTQKEILMGTVRIAAAMHTRHWNNRELLKEGWLRCTDMLQGRNKPRYHACKSSILKKWFMLREAVVEGSLKGKVVIPEKMLAVADASIRSSTWATFQAEYNVNNSPFTMCHGDFHAGNQMWRLGAPKGEEVVMVDWAEIGVNHGETEIGQYLISNATIELRREVEKELVEEYYRLILASGKVTAEEYPLSMCWQRYIRGNVDRWLQMIAVLGSITVPHPQRLPADKLQWFIDQVAAFIDDHVKDGDIVHLAYIYCLPFDL